MDDVAFDTTYPWLIEIEDGCRISTGVRLMAHDATPFRDLGVTRLGQVRILQESFIAERCIILPGVTIGPRAMIAAGSVVSRDVGPGMLAAGNPARVYGNYDEYLARVRENAATAVLASVNGLHRDRDLQAKLVSDLAAGRTILVEGADSDMTFYYNVTEDEVRQRAEEMSRALRSLGRPPLA